MERKPLSIKLSFLSLFLTILFISGCSGGGEKKRNPYNLDIISDIESYNKSIEEDSDNELVDLEGYIPYLKLDIRYATDNNFVGQTIYTAPKAYLRKPVADALYRVQAELIEEGYGIKVFDAYRPYEATLLFYETYLDTTFVASPRTGSVHNKGCAVDLTIIDLISGLEIEMPTAFDDFTEQASIDFMDLPQHIIDNREKLISIMKRHGFDPYKAEWWHFNFRERAKYKLMNLSFKELSGN